MSAWLILHSELKAHAIKNEGRNGKAPVHIDIPKTLSIYQALKTTFLILILKIAETGQRALLHHK